jgi:predicted ester cyclase
MSINENKALVRRAYDEILENGIYDRIQEIVHDDFVDHTNPPGWPTDREGLLQVAVHFRSAFPDIKVTFDDVVCEGDTVMHRQTMRGTHLGEFFGIPPTGTRVTYAGCHLWRVKDGKLIEHHATNDDLGLLRQLGVIPAEEAAVAPESVTA